MFDLFDSQVTQHLFQQIDVVFLPTNAPQQSQGLTNIAIDSVRLTQNYFHLYFLPDCLQLL